MENNICLYAGKLNNTRIYETNKLRENQYKFYGLIINKDEIKDKKIYNTKNHKKCDITKDLLNMFEINSIQTFVSEQVFEHIEYNKLEKTINDIYKILKPGGLLRISLPDYSADVLLNRTYKFNKNLLNHRKTIKAKWPFQSAFKFPLNINGNNCIFNKDKKTNGIKITIDEILNSNNTCFVDDNIIIDLLGGLPNKGGHVWFPTIESVKNLLKKTKFKCNYLCYNNLSGEGVLNEIDLSLGFITRINDNRETNNQKLIIVVDCFK
jgi:hypothetical protein